MTFFQCFLTALLKYVKYWRCPMHTVLRSAVFIILLFALPTFSLAQKSVTEQFEIGSTNTIAFGVSNPTKKPITDIKMVASGTVKWVKITSVSPEKIALNPDAEGTFTLTFTISKDAPVGGSETLNFKFFAEHNIEFTMPSFELTVVFSAVSRDEIECAIDKERQGGDWSGPEQHYTYAFYNHTSGELVRLLIYSGPTNGSTFLIALQSAKDKKFGPYKSMEEAEVKAKELCEGSMSENQSILKLLKIDWLEPQFNTSAYTYKPGDTGFSSQSFTHDGILSNKSSYGFTEFPQEIQLGKPFKFVIDLRSYRHEPARPIDPSGRNKNHICVAFNASMDIWTEPQITLGIGAAAGTKNFDPEYYGAGGLLNGEIKKFKCPSNKFNSSVTVNQASQYVLSFVPNGPPATSEGNTYYKYPYKIETNGREMQEKSIKIIQGNIITITYKQHIRSNGIKISLTSAGNSRPSLSLIYGLATENEPGTHATPYTPPVEMVSTSEESDTSEPLRDEAEGSQDTQEDGERSGIDEEERTDTTARVSDGVTPTPPTSVTERKGHITADSLNPNKKDDDLARAMEDLQSLSGDTNHENRTAGGSASSPEDLVKAFSDEPESSRLDEGGTTPIIGRDPDQEDVSDLEKQAREIEARIQEEETRKTQARKKEEEDYDRKWTEIARAMADLRRQQDEINLEKLKGQQKQSEQLLDAAKQQTGGMLSDSDFQGRLDKMQSDFDAAKNALDEEIAHNRRSGGSIECARNFTSNGIFNFHCNCDNYVFDFSKGRCVPNQTPVGTGPIVRRTPDKSGLSDIVVHMSPTTMTVWDHGTEDLDRVNISLNGRPVRTNLTLRNARQNITLYLRPGNNTLEVEALNIGDPVIKKRLNLSGGNTAALEIQGVVSGKKRQQWTLMTWQKGYMQIYYQP